MTVALALMVGALLIAWLAPRMLEGRLRGATDPRTTLVTRAGKTGGGGIRG